MFGLARQLEAHAVALQRAQFPQQAAEVPHSVALGGLPGPALGFGGGRVPGRGHGRAPPPLGRGAVLLLVQQRRQLLPQVPFQVVGQQAHQRVRPHAVRIPHVERVLYFTLFRQNSSDYSDARPRNFVD